MTDKKHSLARRLGLATNVSVLDYRIRLLFDKYPSETAESVEDWLLDVANKRGAELIRRENPPSEFTPPPEQELTNEELTAAICLIQRADVPQILRLAGQLVSSGKLHIEKLLRLAKRERIEIILSEMAKEALKVDPEHSSWRQISKALPNNAGLRSPVIHWQRLAWPEKNAKGYNPDTWRLVG